MASKDLPIIFSGAMVRALLEGRKTQTRRILKPQPQPFKLDDGTDCDVFLTQIESDPRPRVTLGRCITIQEVRYAVGDRLYVRENFAHVGTCDPGFLTYQATYPDDLKPLGIENVPATLKEAGYKWRPSESILEDCSPNTHARLAQNVQDQIGSDRAHAGGKTNGKMKAVGRHLPGNKSHKGTTAYEAGDERHRTKAGLVAYSDKMRKLADAASGTKNNDSFDAAMAIMPTKRNKRSVWTVATEAFKEAHFATFPPALIDPCIKAGCPEGGTVLDPFGGAGTTGLVADRLRRNAILLELNPEYAAIAERRIAKDAGMMGDVRTERLGAELAAS